MNNLPTFIRKLSQVADCWLVGTAVDFYTGEIAVPPPRDWDIVVTLETWHLAAPLIPPHATPNTFGGWKFEHNGKLFDVWPDRIERLCCRPEFVAAVHLTSGFRLKWP